MGRGARWLGELAVDQARDAALGRVAPTVAPFIDAALYSRNAYRGSRSAYQGLMGVATLRVPERGSRFGSAAGTGAGRPGPRIAGQWFHGAGDRHDALAAIDLTAAALGRDLATVPYALQGWVDHSARPELARWAAFRDVLSASAAALFATRWDTIDEWRNRIMDLHDLVAVAGGTVGAPAVPELPQTLWERAEHGGGDTFDRVLTIARGSAYVILAITGVWGMFAALSSLKRVRLVEETLAEPTTEKEAEAQEAAAAEVEQHGQKDGAA